MRGLAAFDSVVGVTRAFVGLLFVVAGAAKLPARRELATTIRSYEVLSDRGAASLSRVVPPLEISVGAAFAAGVAPAVAGIAISVLLAAFSLGITINLLRGRRAITCGCFGSPARAISWMIVLRNVALAAATLWAATAPVSLGRGTILPCALVGGTALALCFAVRSVVALLRAGAEPEHPASPTPRVHTREAFTAGLGSSPSREGVLAKEGGV